MDDLTVIHAKFPENKRGKQSVELKAKRGQWLSIVRTYTPQPDDYMVAVELHDREPSLPKGCLALKIHLTDGGENE